MKITQPAADGKMPWSPTVVNINRMKAKRSKRSMAAFLIGGLVLVFSCILCGAKFLPQKTTQAKPAAAVITATLKPPPGNFIVATPHPGWTPYPGNPLILYRVEPLNK